MSELRGICLALEYIMRLVQGRKLVIWTDSENAYFRITRNKTDPNKLLNAHISRLLACIWANFSESRLLVQFVPGEDNEGADTLSRWGVRDGCSKVELQTDEDVEEKLLFAVDDPGELEHVGSNCTGAMWV